MRTIFILLLLFSAFQNYALQQNDPSEEEIEALKALPYVQWTDKKVDKRYSGVTRYDKMRAYAGYNFYTNDADEVYLLDMAGKQIHSWKFNGKVNCENAKLLTNGDVIAVCVGNGLAKVDRNSKVQWEIPGPFHHDVMPLPDGRFLALMHSAHSYRQFNVLFDSIVDVSESGRILGNWSTFENHPMLRKYHQASLLDLPGMTEKLLREQKGTLAFDYYHMNTIEILPENPLGKKDVRFRAGNLLIASRNTDLIAILDRVSRKVLWHWGPGELDGPHAPVMLNTGNILIFDNGTRRKYSKVIELDPVSKKVVWAYQGNPPQDFFSRWRGSAQRLPNGNTLICNSEDGQVFEVTPEGKMVWEFWNPIFQKDRRKRIFRFIRLAPDQVSDLIP